MGGYLLFFARVVQIKVGIGVVAVAMLTMRLFTLEKQSDKHNEQRDEK